MRQNSRNLLGVKYGGPWIFLHVYNFSMSCACAVSGDGRVTNWTIVKTTLWYTDELVINFCKNLLNSDATLSTHLLDSGR
jgi:hypothetical protein